MAIRGVEELARTFTALPDVVRVRVLQDATEAGAEIIRQGAEDRAPRRSGQLAGDIQIETELTTDGFVSKIGPSRRSFYGRFQEFGTPFMAARPFLRPALDEDGPRAQQAMAATLARGIEAEAKRLAGAAVVLA